MGLRSLTAGASAQLGCVRIHAGRYGPGRSLFVIHFRTNAPNHLLSLLNVYRKILLSTFTSTIFRERRKDPLLSQSAVQGAQFKDASKEGRRSRIRIIVKFCCPNCTDRVVQPIL